MKPSPTRLLSTPLLCGALLLAPLLLAQSAPQAVTLHIDPARTEIHWTLNGNTHTTHGTFRLKGGLITFDPSTGAAQGEIAVDLVTGESGNHSRDSRMQSDVLESARYPQAIFHPEKVTGTVKAGSNQNVTVDGTFTIHGKDHPLRLDTKVQVDGHEAVATTHFTIPYVDWGMKDPSNFLFRVDKTVDLEVTAKGEIQGAGGRE
jgi:polyisoprenoid-binding protein YceI